MDLQLCVPCEFGISHVHVDGAPPGWPCRSCHVGLHGLCDPLTYFCSCSCGLDKENR